MIQPQNTLQTLIQCRCMTLFLKCQWKNVTIILYHCVKYCFSTCIEIGEHVFARTAIFCHYILDILCSYYLVYVWNIRLLHCFLTKKKLQITVLNISCIQSFALVNVCSLPPVCCSRRVWYPIWQMGHVLIYFA